MTWKKRLAYLAVGTVTAVGLSGAFGTVAFAADGNDVAPTSGPEFAALAQTLLSTDGVQAVAKDGSGNVVIYTTGSVAGVKSLEQDSSNVTVKVLDAPLEAYDADEVVGGAGYLALPTPQSTAGGLCSVGFSAWSPEGDRAVVSAGHCTDDGNYKVSYLTLPTGDPAGGGPDDNSGVGITVPLGNLAFSQYGGPGNTTGTDGDTSSVDISVIDVLTTGSTPLVTRPEVTDWTTASQEDLAASTVPVRSVGSATVGSSITKSGRTTGYTTGTVDSIDGWALVGGRQVYGFMSQLTSAEGDSGGSMIQGDSAVGVVSGGTTQGGQSLVWGANLQAGLALTGGYTISLLVDAPSLVSPADGGDVFSGGAISGTGPAGGTLVVTPGSGTAFDVAIGADGKWSFAAPGTQGTYSYSIVAKKGFDTSSATSFSVKVIPAPLAAPVITTPTESQNVETELTAITGTGEPGATVTLSGDVTDTTLVDQAGKWSVAVALSYGQYSVAAVQTRTGNSPSDADSVSFAVVPVAPKIATPGAGASFAEGAGPTEITGTGIDGATVEVTLNGQSAGSAVVKNGKWSLALGGQIAAGTVTIGAAQAVDGVIGSGTSVTITIVAAGNGGNGGGGTGGGGNASEGGGGGSLANTGATVPFVGGGIALLLAAGGTLLLVRRNTMRRSS